MKKNTKRWLLGTALAALLVAVLLVRPVFHVAQEPAMVGREGRGPAPREQALLPQPDPA